MGKKVDLTGQRFGKLVVIGDSGKRCNGAVMWDCACDCGNETTQRTDHLRIKKNPNCGCVKRQGMVKDVSGERFGKLVVVCDTGKRDINGQVIWNCKCDCGNMKQIIGQSLRKGNAKSCGCEMKKYIGKSKDLRLRKFGLLTPICMTEERSYKAIIWECMCDCGNKALVSSRNLLKGDTKSCGCLKELVLFASGIEHPRYNPQLTDEDRLNRRYQMSGENQIHWSRTVFEKEDFTCQLCGQRGGKLNAHHLNAWNAFPEQRFDLDNGVTLCVDCHKEFHKMYGRGDNTREQFDEYAASKTLVLN